MHSEEDSLLEQIKCFNVAASASDKMSPIVLASACLRVSGIALILTVCNPLSSPKQLLKTTVLHIFGVDLVWHWTEIAMIHRRHAQSKISMKLAFIGLHRIHNGIVTAEGTLLFKFVVLCQTDVQE